MVETAGSLGIKAKIVELSGHKEAQANPSPFGSFALIHNGEVLSHHPISNTRFRNIMNGRVYRSISELEACNE